MNEPSKDALEYLVEVGKKLVPVEIKEFSGRRYSRYNLMPISDPMVSPLWISTLSSLVDLCTGKFKDGSKDSLGFEKFDAAKHVVHVASEKTVEVVAAVSDHWKNRECIVKCSLTETVPFTFGQFLTQDKFIIGLLSTFEETDDRQALVRLAGAAKAEAVTLSHDDGISQEVTLKGGAHLVDKVPARNLVKLAPFRTFREVAQPASQFLFRMQQSGENLPTFALFEADGGAWKLTAIENIARALRVGIVGATIVS